MPLQCPRNCLVLSIELQGTYVRKSQFEINFFIGASTGNLKSSFQLPNSKLWLLKLSYCFKIIVKHSTY